MPEHVNETDMIATAFATQRAETAAERPGALRLVAPAKVNLHLAIGKRQENGYHEAVSIMHALALHDMIYMRRLTPPEIDSLKNSENLTHVGADDNILLHVECSSREGVRVPSVSAENNIVTKAINALAQEIAFTEQDALDVHIEKHIPFEAGLGGGSSDAAAALVGAAHMWGLETNHPALQKVAQAIGADVAFFLQGGCARLEGNGDVFRQSLAPLKTPVVLIKPQHGVSTAQAYKTFDENPVFAREDLVKQANEAQTASDVPLFNNLAQASEVLLPELADVRKWALEQPGVQHVLLCGSGSATFVMLDDFSQASKLSAAAAAKGWWSRTTMFGPLKAALLPND